MSAGWGFALNGLHDEGHANRFVSFGSRQMRCGVAELVLSWRFHVGFLRVSVSGRVLLMCVGEPEVLTGHRCAAQTAAGIGRLLRTSPLLHPAKAFTPERDFDLTPFVFTCSTASSNSPKNLDWLSTTYPSFVKAKLIVLIAG